MRGQTEERAPPRWANLVAQQEMASTIDFTLLRDPQLLDLLDDEWVQDSLPDDGEAQVALRECRRDREQPPHLQLDGLAAPATFR